MKELSLEIASGLDIIILIVRNYKDKGSYGDPLTVIWQNMANPGKILDIQKKSFIVTEDTAQSMMGHFDIITKSKRHLKGNFEFTKHEMKVK